MKTEILVNKKRFLFVIVLSFVLILVGIGMAVFPEDFGGEILGEQFALIIGITIVVIFVGALLFAIIKLVETKVGVTIDEQGITDHVGGMNLGLIPWEDIEALELKKHVGNTFVVIHLKDVLSYTDQFKGFKKRMIKEQSSTFGSPVAIGTAMLKGDTHSIKAAFENAASAHQVFFR